MAIDLAQARRRLSFRYAQFSFLLIAVFAGAIYAAVADARRDSTEAQVRQLAAVAAAELPQLRRAAAAGAPLELGAHAGAWTAAGGASEQGGGEQSSFPKAAASSAAGVPAPRAPSASALTDDPNLRLLWLDPSLRPLAAYGAYQPRESLLPPLAERNAHRLRPLADGLSLWQPVVRRAPGGEPQLEGYVTVALASRSADQSLACLGEGLLVGTGLAAVVALLGGRCLVAAALRPLREQVEHLARFSADASHELRHPLTAVRALIGSLRHGSALEGASPVLMKKLGQIDRTAVHMGQLVDDLLLLARCERSLESDSLRRFPPEELIDDLTSLYASSAQQQGVQLTSQLGWGGELRGHPERLRQLLVNLITNAMRFSPSGGTVTVGVEHHNGNVQIWVDDQGPGIPLEQRELVFEPFWHGEGGRGGGAGTGLGLAIARAIALAHGGQLVARDAPGGGCRMVLGLPQQA